MGNVGSLEGMSVSHEQLKISSLKCPRKKSIILKEASPPSEHLRWQLKRGQGDAGAVLSTQPEGAATVRTFGGALRLFSEMTESLSFVL